MTTSGPPVNRAARIMAAGHGGQVLMAAVTADLVPGLTLRNLGEHRLRDLGNPMLIWQLGTEEFPPLRTLDELPGNLPVQRTSFIGRADEVKELAALVAHERLVTLTGPGGVGKSRLALQVAAEVAPAFRDGVWFASLAALEERALVAATILEALGVPERQGEPAVETLCAWASTREALVVIDNCEHLLTEVAAVVDRVMESSTTIAMLATSQAPLERPRRARLGGRPALGLARRIARQRRAVRRPRAHGSGRLRAQRRERRRGRRDLRAARSRTARDRARRGARARDDAGRHRPAPRSTPPAPGIERSTRARAGTARSTPPSAGRTSCSTRRSGASSTGSRCSRVRSRSRPRKRSSPATVSTSGRCSTESSRSSTSRSSSPTRPRTPRATGCLETMRQFGNANLTAAGIDALYRDRYADYYADYVLSRRPQLHGSGDVAALDDIERELENIRVALRQAADDRSSSRFEELFSTLFTLWVGRGRNAEGASWATELLGRPDLDARARIVALGFGASVTNPASLAVGRRRWPQPAVDLSATHRRGAADRRDGGHESRRHDARPSRSRNRGLRPGAGTGRGRARPVHPRLDPFDLHRGARDLRRVRTTRRAPT